MHRPQLIVCLLVMAMVPSLARADAGSVSEADQEACTPDVFRLCQEFIPNEAPIVACLEAKRAELSPACGRVMFPPATAAPTPENGTPSPKRRRHRRHHATLS